MEFRDFFFLLIVAITAARDEEIRLQQMLLSTYNKELRPPGSTIHISVNLRFFTLLFMQQQEENMVFSGDFEMNWTDASLKWTPSDYQGLKHTNVYEKDVWTPEITIYNSVGQEPVIGNDRRLATLTHEGLVQTSNPSIYTVRCKLNIGKFPFDQQQCTVKFSSWVYTADELAVSAPLEDLDLTNGEVSHDNVWRWYGESESEASLEAKDFVGVYPVELIGGRLITLLVNPNDRIITISRNILGKKFHFNYPGLITQV